MRTRIYAVASIVAVIATGTSAVRAAFENVYGGPSYSTIAGGFANPEIEVGISVNDAGTAVGGAGKLDSSKNNLGIRPVRWDIAGDSDELDNLGTNFGSTGAFAYAINQAGTTVGYAEVYDASHNDLGPRAVLWNASDTSITELGNLGTNSSGVTSSMAYVVNGSGTAAGYAEVYDSSNDDLGKRAVLWDASGTTPTELGYLGTAANGSTNSGVWGINDAGTTVGYAEKYDASHDNLGEHAVRWDASGTAATELGNLGTASNGSTNSVAYAINSTGTSVGYAQKYNTSNINLGSRAVRWDSSETAATELGNLGTNAVGSTNCVARAINSLGTTVGYAEKYDSSNNDLGQRAVRWDASGTTATELGNLGTNLQGFAISQALAINDADYAVGYADTYNAAGAFVSQHAVYWAPNGGVYDLNWLLAPNSGWTLNEAYDISNTGWIDGIGTYDPDGPGGQAPYQRLFIMQLPEPGCGWALFASAMAAMRRKRTGANR